MSRAPSSHRCPCLLASCLVKLDEGGLFPELRNTPRSLAPRKHAPFQEAGLLFPANFYPMAIPPFGFTPDSSEVLPLLSALPFFPPERPTESECPPRVGARGAL